MSDFKKLLALFRDPVSLSEGMEEDSINLYDNFDFEIGEDLIIETEVVGITDEGDIIVEGDDTIMGILEINATVIDDMEESSLMNANTISEAEYQGRNVPLGKPMRNTGGNKKSKVYVRKPNGKVVKVTFGDPNMRIKKSNPERRKSFRARHKCDTAKDRTTARYWSCRMW